MVFDGTFDGKFGSFSLHQVGGSSREKPSFLRRGSTFLVVGRCGKLPGIHACLQLETNGSW